MTEQNEGLAARAKSAYRHYFLGDHSIRWDRDSWSWVSAGHSQTESEEPSSAGISAAAARKIADIQAAERDGRLSHDAAAAEILDVLDGDLDPDSKDAD